MDLSHLIRNFEQAGFRRDALRSAQGPAGVSEHLFYERKDRLDGMGSLMIPISVLLVREPLAQAIQQQLVAANSQYTAFCITHFQANRREGASRAVPLGAVHVDQLAAVLLLLVM